MFVYYLVFIFAYLLCLLDYIEDGGFKKCIYLTFCMLIILLPGFRTVGNDNDSANYEEIFRLSSTLDFVDIIKGQYDDNNERGFMLLNKIVTEMGGSVNVLFLITSVLTGLLNYSLIYKVCKYPFTSLLIYLSFFYLYRDFTQIRYALCCALAAWTIFHVINKRFFLAFLCWFLALSFHNTALILILVIPFCHLIKSRVYYFVLPCLSLIGLVINPFPLLLSLGGVPEHMQIYFNEEGGAGFVISAIGLAMMCIYILVHKKDITYSSEFYFRCVAIGVSLNLLFIQASIFQRFSHLLFQFAVFFFPNVLVELEKNRYKYYFTAIHFLFNCFFLYYGVKLIAPTLIRPYF